MPSKNRDAVQTSSPPGNTMWAIPAEMTTSGQSIHHETLGTNWAARNAAPSTMSMTPQNTALLRRWPAGCVAAGGTAGALGYE